MRITRFASIDTVNQPIDVGMAGLVTAKNMDIDRNGIAKTRAGQTKVESVTVKAAWSDGTISLYLLTNGDLKLLNQNGTPITVDNVQGDTLTGTVINGVIYYSTNQQNGVIEGQTARSLGVEPPLFDVVVGNGGLPAGTYLIAVSQVQDGRESGTVQQSVVVGDNSSITVTANVSTAYVYISLRDGEEMYFAGEGSTFLFNDEAQLIHTDEPVTRQFKYKMPVATIMEEHSGYLLVASGNALIHSDPLDYEIFDARFNVYEFDSEISMVRSVDGGLFLSTQTEVFFAPGRVIDELVFGHVYNAPVKFGTDKSIKMTSVGESAGIGKGAIFTTTKGVCIASPDGMITNISERKVDIDTSGGMTAFVQDSKYVAIKQ